jgi:hypothetical protein
VRSMKGTCGPKMPVTGWKSGDEASAVACVVSWIKAGGK